MKYRIQRTGQFRRDVKRLMKRGKDIEKLLKTVELLANDIQLPASCRDHALKGNYSGFRECHIEPDWLLLYRKNKKQLTLILLRSASYAELF
ncbi:MAG: type II toxin-antitoxin system YafQ family toxin [Lentisphaeria bacterium]|jgi:mRNA interferase YafQ|nr:type II toxin-antitoxin system YafQ family toxin [Lentisphaeria bacterium]